MPKNISKTVLKTRLKTKETTLFVKYIVAFFLSLNKGIFSVFRRFIEDYLRTLMCWEKSKNRIGSKNKKNKNLFIICWVV
jgi:hypothetical protein